MWDRKNATDDAQHEGPEHKVPGDRHLREDGGEDEGETQTQSVALPQQTHFRWVARGQQPVHRGGQRGGAHRQTRERACQVWQDHLQFGADAHRKSLKNAQEPLQRGRRRMSHGGKHLGKQIKQQPHVQYQRGLYLSRSGIT